MKKEPIMRLAQILIAAMRSEEMRFSRKRIINRIISSNSDSDIDMQ